MQPPENGVVISKLPLLPEAGVRRTPIFASHTCPCVQHAHVTSKLSYIVMDISESERAHVAHMCSDSSDSHARWLSGQCHIVLLL